MKEGDKVRIIEVNELNPISMQDTLGHIGTIVDVITNGIYNSNKTHDSYLVKFEDKSLAPYGWEYEAHELELVQ